MCCPKSLGFKSDLKLFMKKIKKTEVSKNGYICLINNDVFKKLKN